MNQIANRAETSINAIGISTGANGSSIAPQNLGEVVRFAEVMCKADIALPKHLRGNAGACMAVAMQAMEWQMSPFAVASKSYSVNGAIAYEAQLIAAVVNTRSGIQGRLKYHFEGHGHEMTCRVVGMLDGEECEYISPTIGSITTKNSPLWKSDPQQQLGYFSARSWARRHCPEVILGVYDREEVEQFRGSETARDVTPSLSQRLQLAKIEQHNHDTQREGFDPDFTTHITDQVSSASPSPADENGSGVSPSNTAPSLSASNGDETGEPSFEAGHGDAADSSPVDPIRKELMRECIDNMIRAATDADKSRREDLITKSFAAWQNELPSEEAFVKRVFETCCRLIEDPAQAETARKYLMAKVA